MGDGIPPGKRKVSCYTTGIPQPVILIATQATTPEVINIAPISWVSLVGGKPPRLVLCVLNRHDTRRNLERHGQFSANVPNGSLADRVAVCARALPPEDSENDEAGFTLLHSTHIDVPIIAECRANLECEVLTAVDVGHSKLFTAAVLAAYVDTRVVGGGLATTRAVDPLLYVGENDCVRVGELVRLAPAREGATER